MREVEDRIERKLYREGKVLGGETVCASAKKTSKVLLLCAAGLMAADYQYKAGTAAADGVKVLALEDRRGNRAVIAEADGAVTRQVSDVVSATVMKEYELDRGFILLRGAGSRPATSSAFLEAIRAAFQALAPAALRSTPDALYVSRGALWAKFRPASRVAAPAPGQSWDTTVCISPAGALEVPCAKPPPAAAAPVRAPIRAAFQMVDLTHGLIQRGDPARVYPVQAIALGKTFAILALGGEAPVNEFRRAGVIVAPFSNDAAPFPEDPRVRAAIRQVLRRVGR
jgi:hypothetical protein